MPISFSPNGIHFWSLAKSNKLPPPVQKPPIANNLKIAEVKFTKFHIFRSMSRRSGLLSRPAGEAGRARSGPCSGSWCWWRRRVSGAGEGAADSCGGSGGRTSRTGEQWGPQIKKRATDKIFFDFSLLFKKKKIPYSVRLLSGVNAQVALQGLQVAEAGATGVAGVRLLPRMDQDVGPEVGNLTPGQNPTVRLRFVIKTNVSFNPRTWIGLMPCVRYDMFDISQWWHLVLSTTQRLFTVKEEQRKPKNIHI